MGDPHFQNLLDQGFTVRPARLEDVPTAVPMFNAAESRQYGVAPFTIQRYLQEWQAPGFDRDRDTRLIFSPKDELVGCAEVWTLADPPVHPWIWGRVHPNWEGRGIGTAMLAWSLTRSTAALGRVTEKARVAPRVGTRPGHAASTALFADFGFSLVRMSWVMRIDLATPPATASWPSGIRLRAYRHPEDLEAVFQCFRDSFSDHWGFVDAPYAQGLGLFRHTNTVLRPVEPALWFLAMDGDELAAISLCRARADDDPEMGWVEILGVRKPWRRKGLGLALLLHSFHALRARGALRAGLGVDAGSLTGATRLYRRAGMSVARESALYEMEIRPGKELGREA